MNDMKNELTMEEMQQASGGVLRTVNTNTSDNAAVRSAPTQARRNQIASLPNGTVVDTIDEKHPVYDEYSGRNYVMISFIDKNGRQKTGWIAASIVGLRR